MTVKTGAFHGIGAGPGDPELLTLKSVRILKASKVIAVPRSRDSGADKGSNALEIVKKAVDLEGKELLDLPFPMTKDPSTLNESRRAASSAIVKRLKTGVDVAFITLGDPLLYSTFSYLAPYIKEELPEAAITVSPGITSFSAVAASLLLPLAEADQSVAIIPAAYEMADIKEKIQAFDTVVFMKVNKKIDELIDMLVSLGLEHRSCLVSRAGCVDEVSIRGLGNLKGFKPGYFSTIIVKK